MMRVVAIVPAYDEGPRIGEVLRVLTAHPAIDEVIVVDDGSSDDTAAVARTFGITLIRHDINRGKGAALASGVAATDAPILMFCDADLIGLQHGIVTGIIEPVKSGTVDMFVAARESKTRRLGLGMTYTPLLDGQRALTRALWDAVPTRYKHRFRIEAALNATASREPFRYAYSEFPISHVRKEEKRGIIRGSIARYDMYMDVATTILSTTWHRYA